VNRTQRQILSAGALVVLVLVGVGFWSFTSGKTLTQPVGPISAPATTTTWTETASCSILIGTRSFDAPGRPVSMFSVSHCDEFEAWREPVLVAVVAAVVLTLLAALWTATPRARLTDTERETPSPSTAAPPPPR